MIIFYICAVAAELLLVVMCFMFAMNMDKMNKKLKDLQDNQFDANQVMELYVKKYAPKPMISEEKINIIALEARTKIPNYRNRVTEDDIKHALSRELSEKIKEYMYFDYYEDPVNMAILCRGKLDVVSRK